jgi:hypothetical protein
VWKRHLNESESAAEKPSLCSFFFFLLLAVVVRFTLNIFISHNKGKLKLQVIDAN